MALLYDHIKLAYVMPNLTASTSSFIRDTTRLLISNTGLYDFTNFIADGMKVFVYRSGNSFYHISTSYFSNWPNVMAFIKAHPEYSKENLFYHYAQDKVYTTATRNACIMCAGYPAGTIGGYGAGSASALSHSRMISPQWPATFPGDAATYNTTVAAPPFRNTIISIVRSGGTVTVTTGAYTTPYARADHCYSVGDRVEIAGVPLGANGTDFNGIFDVVDDPTPTTFTYLDARSDDTSSGGTSTYYHWNCNVLNYSNPEWSAFYAADFDNILTDSAGNKVHGYFFDSILNIAINGTAAEFAKCKECIDDGGAANWVTWILGEQSTFFTDHMSRLDTWRGDTQGELCCNGDGTTYALNTRDANGIARYEWHVANSDVVLLEGGQMPRQTLVSSFQEGYWRNAWSLMESGTKVIWQGDSQASMPQPTTWTNYSGNVWYTDVWADSRTKINMIGDGIGVPQVEVNSIAEVTATDRLYHDLATGRVYVYSTTSPSTTRNFRGHEKYRFMPLCLYYCFGCHENGYYYEHEGEMTSYNRVVPSIETWFDAIAYDIGQPAAGGVKSDGNYGVDLGLFNPSAPTVPIPGTSTETSTRGYTFWTRPGSTAIKAYARKFDNAYCIFRICQSSMAECGTDPQLINIPFAFRRLRGDGTLDDVVQANIGITMVMGEGAILVTNFDQTPPTPDSTKYLIGIFK